MNKMSVLPLTGRGWRGKKKEEGAGGEEEVGKSKREGKERSPEKC